MIIFGIKYLYSNNHIKQVERTADIFAIEHGMASYIVKTKNFIFDHADISEQYKNKLRRLYMSPEEIMHIINQKA